MTLPAEPPSAPRPAADCPRRSGRSPSSTGGREGAGRGAFAPVWVRGEVTGFKAYRSGHWYFTLRTPSAQVRCVHVEAR